MVSHLTLRVMNQLLPRIPLILPASQTDQLPQIGVLTSATSSGRYQQVMEDLHSQNISWKSEIKTREHGRKLSKQKLELWRESARHHQLRKIMNMSSELLHAMLLDHLNQVTHQLQSRLKSDSWSQELTVKHCKRRFCMLIRCSELRLTLSLNLIQKLQWLFPMETKFCLMMNALFLIQILRTGTQV